MSQNICLKRAPVYSPDASLYLYYANLPSSEKSQNISQQKGQSLAESENQYNGLQSQNWDETEQDKKILDQFLENAWKCHFNQEEQKSDELSIVKPQAKPCGYYYPGQFYILLQPASLKKKRGRPANTPLNYFFVRAAKFLMLLKKFRRKSNGVAMLYSILEIIKEMLLDSPSLQKQFYPECKDPSMKIRGINKWHKLLYIISVEGFFDQRIVPAFNDQELSAILRVIRS